MKDCPHCKGTGFYKGFICVCITKPNDVSEVMRLMEMMGMKEKKP